MATNEFIVRKGLIVNGSGSTVLDIQGSQGQLFSVTDDLTGTLFSVNDISGIPILSVDSDDTVTMGTFGENTLVVTGSRVGVLNSSPTTALHVAGQVSSSALETSGNVTVKGNLTVNGSTSISGLDADTLDGQHGAFYQNASNINAGTLADARLPNSISSDITGNAATATIWATARTISIGGTGKSVNGSGDVTWSTTEIGITKSNIDSLNIDADTLDGEQGSFYQNASNLNAGTINDARLPNSISSNITGNAATATKWAGNVLLTIGDTGKNVDGSGPVIWSTTEIGITKSNIDALNINADTLDGQHGAHYLDYTNFNNTPSLNFDNYQSWTVTDGTNSGTVTSTREIRFTGTGATSVSFNNSTGYVTINSTDTNTDTNSFVSAGSYNATTKDLTLTIADQIDPVIDLTAIDADKLDGQEGSYYRNYNNLTNKPSLNFDNYQSWTVTDGTNSGTVTSTREIRFTGTGATSVSFNNSTGYVTIDSTDTNTDTNSFVSAGSYNATTKDLTLTVTGQVDPVIDLTAIDADKLDGQEGSYYRNYNNLTNKPAVIVDGDFTTAGFMKTDGSGTYSVDSNTYLTSVSLSDVTQHLSVVTQAASGGGELSLVNGEFRFKPAVIPTGFITAVNTSATSGLSGGASSGDVSLALSLSSLTSMTTTPDAQESIAILEGANTKKITLGSIPLGAFDNTTSGFISDYTVTQGDVTAHQAALSITESQIGDLGTYVEANFLSINTGTASGGGTLSYDNAGVLTFRPASIPNVSNFITLSQARAGLSVSGVNDPATATGGISYSSSNGVFTYSPPNLSSFLESSDVGNGTITISAGNALSTGGSFTTNQSGNATITLNHSDTSTQATVTNTGDTVIQSITLDTYGHVTSLASKDLSSKLEFADLSITTEAASGNGSLSYASTGGTAGTFTFTPAAVPNVSNFITLSQARAGLSINPINGTVTATGGLSYSSSNGVFQYSPPDLSSFLESSDVGNGTITITAGNALSTGGSFTTNQSGNTEITLNHSDTSTQGNVTNTGDSVIQSISLDTYGHVTSLSSKDLSSKIEFSDLSLTTNPASGNGNLQYTSTGGTAGTFSFTPAAVPDVSNFITLSQARGGLSVNSIDGSVTATGGISYDNSNGVFQYSPPDLSSFVESSDVGNGTITISAGNALSTGGSFTTNQSGNATITINHSDTSTLSGGYGGNDNGIVIEDITVDGRGHVTAIGTRDLDSRFVPNNANIVVVNSAGASGGGNLEYDSGTQQFTFTPAATSGGGDITAVTAGNGLSGGGTSGAVSLALDVGELTEKTDAVAASSDFLVVFDASAGPGIEERKMHFSNIDVSAFNNDANYSTGGGSGAVSSVTNGANNRVATFSGADSLNGEANLTFDGTNLSVITGATDHANLILNGGSSVLDKQCNIVLKRNGVTKWQIQNHTNDNFRIYDNTANKIVFLIEDNGDMNLDPGGNVGIGTTSPSSKFTITNATGGAESWTGGIRIENTSSTTGESAIAFSNDGTSGTGSNQWILGLNQSSHFDIAYGTQFTNGNTHVRVLNNGKVGISLTSPSYLLHVGGQAKINTALGVGVNPTATTGRIDASNDVVAFSTSDKRLKENIISISNPLSKIEKISGVEFDWKPLTEEEKETVHGFEGHDVGVIAQEVEEVLPEVVTERDNGYKAVKYEKIVPLLIEGIKELKSENDTLRKELEDIKKIVKL